MSIPDVLEDVTEIILNLKKVRFKLQPGAKITYQHLQAGNVLASDIESDGTVGVTRTSTSRPSIGEASLLLN